MISYFPVLNNALTISLERAPYPLNVSSANFTNGSGTIVSANTGGVNNFEFVLDISNMPDSSVSSPSFIIDFNVFVNTIRLQLPGLSTFNMGALSGVTSAYFGNAKTRISKTVSLPSFSSKAELASSVVSSINGDYLFDIPPTWGTEGTLSSKSVLAVFAGSLLASVSGVSIAGNLITFKIIPKLKGLNVNTASIWEYYTGGLRDITINYPVVSWKEVSLNNAYNINYSGFKLQNLNKTFFIKDSVFTTFKSGQNHKFGIVYYDLHNRSSAVNEIGEIYNPTEGERVEAYGAAALGSTKAIIRIQSEPPSWAKKWKLVYAPYQTYSFCYTYSAAEAFVGKDATSTGSTQNRAIYVSARHLEGKISSYKENRNAIVDYQYAEGDKLRIISYRAISNDSIAYPKQLVYDIIGYEYFDSTNTPVALATGATNYTERATGLFFILKDENYTNFNADSIINNRSLWSNDTIFEVVRPIKSTSPSIYKETNVYGDVAVLVGPTYYHKSSSRDRTYVIPDNTITVTSGTVYASGSTKIYPGDILEFQQPEAPPGVPSILVRDTYLISDGRTVILYEGSLADGSYEISNILNKNDSILEAVEGDCYYRPRQIKLNPYTSVSGGSTAVDPANVSGIRYIDYFVEDTSISDFYVSNNLSLGRPNVSSSNAKQIERKSSITYSVEYLRA